MLLNWIYSKLIQKRNKERHNVIKLQWQKAELERKIADVKIDRQNTDNHK